MSFCGLRRPLFFAHRGASRTAPENTLEAFERAVQAGVDVLEMDVHLSSDGYVVVHHDPTLDRTTDGAGELKRHTLKQLRALDAGYRFKHAGSCPFRGKGLRIPLFAEVLETFPNLAFNVEVKQREPRMVHKVLEVLQAAGSARVLLTAADHQIMVDLEQHYTGDLGMSQRQCLHFWAGASVGLAPKRYRGRAFQVPPRQSLLPVLTPRVLKAARRLGVDVHVWTLNDADEARHWLNAGVDGVMTDDPDALKSLFQPDGAAVPPRS